MPKTVLNYPVQLDATSSEPTLYDMIVSYYFRHLPAADAEEAAVEYVTQIHDAESFLKVEFAKFVLSKIDLPEGVDFADLVQKAAEKVRAEQAAKEVLAELADEEHAAEFVDENDMADANQEQPVTFDDPKITVMLFTDGTLESYLNKLGAGDQKHD